MNRRAFVAGLLASTVAPPMRPVDSIGIVEVEASHTVFKGMLNLICGYDAFGCPIIEAISVDSGSMGKIRGTEKRFSYISKIETTGALSESPALEIGG